MKVNLDSIYHVNIDDAGYIVNRAVDYNPATGFGWKATPMPTSAFRPRYSFLSEDVIKANGSIWVGSKVLTALGQQLRYYKYSGARLTVGRATYIQVTIERLSEWAEHNAYERRSQREREVQDRNDSLIAWLETLVNELS